MHNQQQPVSPDRLGNEDSGSIYEGHEFSQHPTGFKIFLQPDELDTSDEYSESDPYTVIENLENQFHQRRINCTLKMIKSHAKKDCGNLLDLGCGQGHITALIKQSFPGLNVYGLDYSVSAIDYAHANFKEIDFIVANAYVPPYPQDYFDIVVCNNIWEHVPNPLSLLESISKIMKPNGLLVISTPSRYRLTNLYRALTGKNIRLISKHHVTEYTVGQVMEQLQFGGYDTDHVYSPEIKSTKLLERALKWPPKIFLRIVKSHHILEATVFYAARKRVK